MKKTYALILSILLLSTNSFAQIAQLGDVRVTRFDKTFYNYINKPSKKDAKDIETNNKVLVYALAQTITNTSDQKDVIQTLTDYYNHPTLKKIYKETVDKYIELPSQEKSLTEMLQLAQREFNVKTPPLFSTHISGFKENSIYVNGIISLSLDKYMGKDYTPYKGYFRGFQLEQMQEKMIVRDFTKAWLMADFIKTESTQGDLLSEMIEAGKLLYALSILLPDYPERDLIGYTAQEENWVNTNHKKIWNSIVKQNHLFTTDRHTITPYFDEISSSKTGIKGAPVVLGRWIGYQIVKQYAKETNSSLKHVIGAAPLDILRDSEYKQK